MDEVDLIIKEIFEMQRRTSKRLEKIEQLGLVYDISETAYIVLYDVLKREFDWKVGVLERTWQSWGKEPEEVDVFGQASDPTRPDKTIWIVGEAKHNLTTREVEHFIDQAERAREHLTGEVFPVCFCYRARPEVQEMVEKAGIRLVYSYGKLV